MKRVIIESPYAGDTGSNTLYARRALLDCLKRGEAPMASHLLYTQVLDDADPLERNLGIEAGYEWMKMADFIAFYTDNGWSPGMLTALKKACVEGMEVRLRHISWAPAIPERVMKILSLGKRLPNDY